MENLIEVRAFNPDERARGMVIANEIYHQLCPRSIQFLSWGAHNLMAGMSQDGCMTFLQLTVNGNHFKGLVRIFLTPMDTYTIQLVKDNKLVEQIEDIYFDQLMDVIDRRIERVPEYVV